MVIDRGARDYTSAMFSRDSATTHSSYRRIVSTSALMRSRPLALSDSSGG
jgi:hypothetical protein